MGFVSDEFVRVPLNCVFGPSPIWGGVSFIFCFLRGLPFAQKFPWYLLMAFGGKESFGTFLEGTKGPFGL